MGTRPASSNASLGYAERAVLPPSTQPLAQNPILNQPRGWASRGRVTDAARGRAPPAARVSRWTRMRPRRRRYGRGSQGLPRAASELRISSRRRSACSPPLAPACSIPMPHGLHLPCRPWPWVGRVGELHLLCSRRGEPPARLSRPPRLVAAAPVIPVVAVGLPVMGGRRMPCCRDGRVLSPRGR